MACCHTRTQGANPIMNWFWSSTTKYITRHRPPYWSGQYINIGNKLKDLCLANYKDRIRSYYMYLNSNRFCVSLDMPHFGGN